MASALLVAALVPAIALMVHVYRKDAVEKEALGLVACLFALGMVAGPLAALVVEISSIAPAMALVNGFSKRDSAIYPDRGQM